LENGASKNRLSQHEKIALIATDHCCGIPYANNSTMSIMAILTAGRQWPLACQNSNMGGFAIIGHDGILRHYFIAGIPKTNCSVRMDKKTKSSVRSGVLSDTQIICPIGHQRVRVAHEILGGKL
jgi:hypothetical protein